MTQTRDNAIIGKPPRPRGWFRWGLGMFGLLVAVPGSAAPFEAHWVGEAPESAELRGVGTTYHLPLAINTERRMFSADYTGNAGLTPLRLIAHYADNSTAVLPLRLWQRPEGFSVDIHRISVNTCNVQQRGDIHRTAGGIALALQRYYRAAALYALNNSNRCQGYAQRAVVQAWYERSYELMTLGSFFRLDPEAEAAMREHNPRYDVAAYRRQAIGREIQVANRLKAEAWSEGRLDEALAISLGLSEALEDNEYRTIALELQGLDSAMLNRETALLTEAAGQMSEPAMTASEAAFEVNFSEVDLDAQLEIERDAVQGMQSPEI